MITQNVYVRTQKKTQKLNEYKNGKLIAKAITHSLYIKFFERSKYNMKKQIISFCNKVKEKGMKAYKFCKKYALELVISMSAILPCSTVLDVYASTVNTVDEVNLISKVLDIIFTIFRYIGILLLAWSIGMLVLAFKNEDADSKSRAIMMMVVSVVLIGVKTLFTGLGLITTT